MSTQKRRIVYSLRVHIALQERGFKPIVQMPNPAKQNFICWVYEWSEEFQKAFDEILALQN